MKKIGWLSATIHGEGESGCGLEGQAFRGKVLMATVKGDVHDIGKILSVLCSLQQLSSDRLGGHVFV